MTIKIEKSGGKARFKANDQEFLVADDGNVGIGTANPNAKLDVAAALPASSEVFLRVGQSNGNTASQVELGVEKNSNGVSDSVLKGSTGNGGLCFKTGSETTERMRITSNGNVGIGTANPAAKLDVAGTANFDSNVSIAVNGTPNPNNKLQVGGDVLISKVGNDQVTDIFGVTTRAGDNVTQELASFKQFNISGSGQHSGVGIKADVGGAGIIGSVGNGPRPLSFETDATERMRISSNGNVGIGTDNPATKLDVAGVIQGGTSNATNGQTILTGNYVGGNKLNTLGSNRTEGGTVIGYAVKPKEGANSDDFVSSAGNASFHRSAYTAGITHRWFTQGTSSNTPIGSDVNMTERMRITSNGNVGIGTDNPATKLHVDGDATINGVTISSLIARIEALEAGN